MADKNIQMSQRNTANTGWDNLYPITKAENVLVSNSEVVDNKFDLNGVSYKYTLSVDPITGGLVFTYDKT